MTTIGFRLRRFVNYILDRDFSEEFGRDVTLSKAALVHAASATELMKVTQEELEYSRITTLAHQRAIPFGAKVLHRSEKMDSETITLGWRQKLLCLGWSGWKDVQRLALHEGLTQMFGEDA